MATSALKMMLLQLDFHIDITILKSLIKLCRDYVGCSVCPYFLQRENTLIWPNCFLFVCLSAVPSTVTLHLDGVVM